MKNKTFEENYARLEEIVSILQRQEVGVDESIKLFKEAIEIKKYCSGILKDAQAQVVEIIEETKDNDESI